MKATLEFDLDEYDDILAHLRCIKSLDMSLALDSIWSHIGELWRDTKEGELVDIDNLKEHIQEILEMYDVYPDKLIQ